MGGLVLAAAIALAAVGQRGAGAPPRSWRENSSGFTPASIAPRSSDTADVQRRDLPPAMGERCSLREQVHRYLTTCYRPRFNV